MPPCIFNSLQYHFNLLLGYSNLINLKLDVFFGKISRLLQKKNGLGEAKTWLWFGYTVIQSITEIGVKQVNDYNFEFITSNCRYSALYSYNLNAWIQLLWIRVYLKVTSQESSGHWYFFRVLSIRQLNCRSL